MATPNDAAINTILVGFVTSINTILVGFVTSINTILAGFVTSPLLYAAFHRLSIQKLKLSNHFIAPA